MLYMYSEFDLPWFDLDVREAKDSVRTTRSRAKAAKPSTAESSGTCMWNLVRTLTFCLEKDREGKKERERRREGGRGERERE